MRRIALYSSFAFLIACSSGKPGTVTPQASTDGSADGVVATQAPIDMSPVSKPKNVVLTIRFNNPAKSVDSIDKVMNLPMKLRPLLNAEMERAHASAVDLSGEVDVAIAFSELDANREPKFFKAISIPIKDISAAVETFRKMGSVRENGNGTYRLQVKDVVCDLNPSLGETSSRAICSKDDESLAALTPWMTRGLPAEPRKVADAWVRVDAAPLKELVTDLIKHQADSSLGDLRDDISKGLRTNDDDILGAPSLAVHELTAFLDDVDGLEASLSLDDKKVELRGKIGLHFRSKTSWLTEVMESSIKTADAPPAAFFRLPKDAVYASWGRSPDSALFSGIRGVGHKLFAAIMANAPSQILSDADKQSLVSWVDLIPSTTGVWSTAVGFNTAKHVTDANLTAQQAVDETKALAKELLPWVVSSGDGDPASSIAWLKQSEDTINRIVGAAKTFLGKRSGPTWFLPTAKLTKDPAGYPKGSAALDITMKFSSKDVWPGLPQNGRREQPDGTLARPTHPAGAEAKGEVNVRLVVVPDDAGHFVWGFASDNEVLKARVNAALATGGGSSTLSARTDLGTLKDHKGFGAFLTLGPLLDNAAASPLLSRGGKNNQFKELIGALPHHGAGPIFLVGSGDSGQTPSFALEAVIGKEWLEDLGKLIEVNMARGKKEAAATPSRMP